jgi:hypothetical protein
MKAVRGGVADVLNLVTALDPLPETADELQRVAASVGATEADIILGPKATETRVKQTKLSDYRIVYFATHGLLAGEVAKLAKLNAEPALVLSLPDNPTPFDDGLLTASEAAQFKQCRLGGALGLQHGVRGRVRCGSSVGARQRIFLCRGAIASGVALASRGR